MHLMFGYMFGMELWTGMGIRSQKMTTAAHVLVWILWTDEAHGYKCRMLLRFCSLSLISQKPRLSFKERSFPFIFPSPSFPHFTLLITLAGCPPGWDYSESRVTGGCWEGAARCAFSFTSTIWPWLMHVENNQPIQPNSPELLKGW